jgi:hypothetical protein
VTSLHGSIRLIVAGQARRLNSNSIQHPPGIAAGKLASAMTGLACTGRAASGFGCRRGGIARVYHRAVICPLTGAHNK